MSEAKIINLHQEADLGALGDYVRDLCLVRGEIELASGRTSDFYFNMKPLMMHPAALQAAARALASQLPSSTNYIGGLEMGAVPLTAAVLALDESNQLRGFFIRKQAKEHGLHLRIEGLEKDASLNGKRVVVLDDVATTGGSALDAAQMVRAAGGEVSTILTLLDREEGAAENMAKQGITLLSCLKAKDILK